MPYLQLDLPHAVDASRKLALARRLVAAYAEHMQTTERIVNVGFRELAYGPLRFENGADGEPSAIVMLACDIRAGRTPGDLERTAERLVAIVAESLDVPAMRVVVEFTQHPGSEMYRYGAVARDWNPAESAG